MELKMPKIKIKKILPYALPVVLLAVIFFVSPFPFGVKAVHAANGVLDFFFGDMIDIGYETLLKILAGLASAILWFVNRLLWVTGGVFDLTLDLTLKSSSILDMPAVKAGWIVCRDVVNIFFIFIILYIAIATILRLSGYGMKQLLVKVIILALLVNFSLMITRVIIDASNVLALEFYDAVSGATIKTADGGQKKGSITEVMMYALKLQTIYNADKMVDPNISDTAASKDAKGNPIVKQEVLPTISGVLITTLMGAAFILVTAFVFLAATIMFAIRTVTLMFLMILSPLAFLGMALPATSGYSSQWWDKLFKQAFFAPAFMFMLYLSMKISVGLTPVMLSSGNSASMNGSFSTAFTSNDHSSLGIIFNFIILIGLMLGSLIVAQSMGAGGSKAMVGWGNKMKGKAQGYAGKIAKRGATSMAGGLAEKALGSEGAMKVLGRIPLATRGLAKMSSMRNKQNKDKEKEYEKNYSLYTDAGIAGMLRDPMITGAKRKEILGIQNKRKEDYLKKEERKKNITEEDNEYKEIQSKLPENVGKYTEDKENEIIAMEAEISGLEGRTSGRAMERRIELNIKKKQTEKEIKKVEKMTARKKEIEQSKEKRNLEERIEKAEKKVGEATSKSNTPPPAPKT